MRAITTSVEILMENLEPGVTPQTLIKDGSSALSQNVLLLQKAAHWASGATGLSAQKLVAEEAKVEQDLGKERIVLFSRKKGSATRIPARQSSVQRKSAR